MDSEQLYAAALERTRPELLPPAAPPNTSREGTSNGPHQKEENAISRSVSGERSIVPVETPGALVDSPPALVNFPPTFPSHKRIPGTRFVVDGFRVAGGWSHSYFLTHFHSDHYQGITDNWQKGVIFCSETTARMVAQVLEVPGPFIVPLPLDQEVKIDGCGVTLVDANHCPGAIQFLFRVPGDLEKRYVHCGDMRYCREMTDNPCIAGFVGADAVYLDTTYCNPRYVFPPQEESVEYVAATIAARMQEWETECEAWLEEHPENPARIPLTDSGRRQSKVAVGKLSAPSEGNGENGSAGKKVGECEAASVCKPAESKTAECKTAESPEKQLENGENDESQAVGTELAAKASVGSALSTGVGASLLERVLAQPVGSSDCPRPPLFIIATYVIGKEKILSAVAARCGCKIYVDDRKVEILRCLGLPDLSIFTTDPSRSNVHVVGWGFLGDAWPFFRANFANMEQALTDRGYEEAVGFVPTGWTYELKRKAFPTREKGRCKIHLVPYSEHSNYAELREYVSFLKPKQIIPTVGVDEKGMDGKAVAAMRKHFRNLVDETAGKRRFLRSFQKSASGKKTPEALTSAEASPVPSGTSLPLLEGPVSPKPLDQNDTCQDPKVPETDDGDEDGDDTDVDDEAQKSDDPDYVASEAETDGPDEALDWGVSGKRVKREGLGSGCTSTAEDAADERIKRPKGSPAGRLTPVLTRRVKRKGHGEKEDVRARKRPTFDLKPKSEPKSEPKLEEAGMPADSVETKPEPKSAVGTELERGVSAGMSWLQAHRQALQGVVTVSKPVTVTKPVTDTDGELEGRGNAEETGGDSVRTDAEQPGKVESKRSEKLEGEKIEQLRAILPGLAVQRAGVLLARAGGDVAGAVTWFYDGGGGQDGAAGNENGVAAGGTEPQAEVAGMRDEVVGEKAANLTVEKQKEGARAAADVGESGDVTGGDVIMDDVIPEPVHVGEIDGEAMEATDRTDRTAEASTSGRTAGNARGIHGESPQARTPKSEGTAENASGYHGEGLRPETRSGRTAGNVSVKAGDGGLRSPPRTPNAAGKKAAQSPAAKRKAPAARNANAGSKKGRVDRQQPSILSFFGGGKKEVKTEDGHGLDSCQAVGGVVGRENQVMEGVSGLGLEENEAKDEGWLKKEPDERLADGKPGGKVGLKAVKKEPGLGAETGLDGKPRLGAISGLGAGLNSGVEPGLLSESGSGQEVGLGADEKLGQLLSILGGEVTKVEAVASLDRAGGDVNRAVEWFYNGLGTLPGGKATESVPLRQNESAESNGTENKRNGKGTEGKGTERERNGKPGAELWTRTGAVSNSESAEERPTNEPSAGVHKSEGLRLEAVTDKPVTGDAKPLLVSPLMAVKEEVKELGSEGGTWVEGGAKNGVKVGVNSGVDSGVKGEVVRGEVNAKDKGGAEAEFEAASPGGSKVKLEDGVTPGVKNEIKIEHGESEGMVAKAEGVMATPERQLGGVVAMGKVGVGDGDRTAVTLPLAKYNSVGNACWKRGEAAPYLHLARTFEILERERGRLKMADILCNMFRSMLALSPTDILPAVYLSTNRVAPDFENVDMSIGGSTVGAAIAEATGTSKAQMRELYNSLGDLGDVALACKQRQATLMAPPPLRVAQVYGALRKISKETGPGCNNRKKNIVLGLLRACREKETQFVVRTLVLNMRIGAMMKTVLPALAQAVVIHKSLPSDRPAGLAINGLKAKLQEASAAMVEAYNFCPNLDVLVPVLVEGGIEAVVAQGAVALGTPIKPMLAKITNGIPEILKRFQGQAFTAEFKYDGQRAQIHLLSDRSVKIFSRNCDDNTGKFPDVIDTVKQAAKGGCSSFIIDAELVAVDRSVGNRLMAFQTLSTRARGGEKTKIEVADVRIAVCVFAFDLLYVDGRALVKEPFRERRRMMREAFPGHSDGHFEFAREVTVEAADARQESEATSALLQSFLQEAFSSSCEGMMVKALDTDAGYAASKRSDSWLKVKKDYIDGLNDSLDLVPIGAWYGQGRKVGWFSPFLLACYDPEREEYQSVCRVMSGFTDVFYKETSQVYRDERLLDQKPPYYRTLEQPDVWFRPHDVWEIRGADLTVSPVHAAAAGLVHPTRGISMRFPRMIKTRPDKKPEDASPPPYIADLFHRQTRKLDLAPVQEQETKRSPRGALPVSAEDGEGNESGEESDGGEGGRERKPPAGLDD